MRKRTAGDGRRGCGCTGLDFLVLFLVLVLVAWFGPWRRTLLEKARPFVRGVPGVRRILPSPPPPTRPTVPEPTPSPTVATSPSAPPSLPSPSPVPTTAPPSPTPEPTATPDDAPTPAAPYGALSDDQKERVRRVMETLKGVNDGEVKRWQDDLAYDANPEREIRAWEAASAAYDGYVRERPGLNEVTRREAFEAALMRTLLPEPEAIRYLKLTAITPDEAKRVMAKVDVKPAPLPLSTLPTAP